MCSGGHSGSPLRKGSRLFSKARASDSAAWVPDGASRDALGCSAGQQEPAEARRTRGHRTDTNNGRFPAVTNPHSLRGLPELEQNPSWREGVLNYIASRASITNRECRQLLGVSSDHATALFKALLTSGDIVRVGSF